MTRWLCLMLLAVGCQQASQPMAASAPTQRGEYHATVLRVHDGDTINVDIYLGLGVWMRDQPVRFYGIDTPELHGPERANAILARDFVAQRCDGKEVLLQVPPKREREKYGRILATVIADGVVINDELLSRGLAKQVDY